MRSTPGLPERGRCFARFSWAREGCLPRASAWELGDQRGLCPATLGLPWTASERGGVGGDGLSGGPEPGSACLRGRGRGCCGRRDDETDFPGSSPVNPPFLWLSGGEEGLGHSSGATREEDAMPREVEV